MELPFDLTRKIPSQGGTPTADTDVNSTVGDDLSPSEMEALANSLLDKASKGKNKDKDNPDDPNNTDDTGKGEPSSDPNNEDEDNPQEKETKINELTEKFNKDQDSLTDEEIDFLKKEGLLEEEGEVDDETKQKLEELSKKDPNTLTDEEKKFIEDNKEEPEIIDSMVASFKDQGVQFEENQTFDNNTEGALKLATHAAKQLAASMLMDHFETNPVFKSFYDHTIVQGKSVDTFVLSSKTPQYENYPIKEVSDTNTDKQNEVIVNSYKKIIKEALLTQVKDDDVIEASIEKFELEDKLYDKAKDSKKYLVELEKAEVAKKVKAEEAKLKEEEELAEKEWSNITSMLNKNDLGDGIKIPTADLKEFKKAVLVPIDENGRTTMDYLRAKQTLSQKLLGDYMLFKKFSNLKNKDTSSKKRTLKFKKAADENSKRNPSRLGGAGTKKGSNAMRLSDINFSDIKMVN